MVNLVKKVIANQTYYLVHTIRKDNKIEKIERYIGKILPENIEEIKKKFSSEIYKEKWYKLFNKIKKSHFNEFNGMPRISREKEIGSFMIKFTYDTQRIEGSKLTLRETADLLEKGVSPRSKSINDIKEAEAHKKIFYEILKYKKDISLHLILHLHKELFQNTKPEIAGKIRQHKVAISGSKFMPPYSAEVYPLLMEFFKWYNKYKDKLHPVELSALVHLKFVTIHPFADGNGRISRILMNLILNRYSYPLSDIHYEDRTSYYNALERSQINKIESIFLNWFSKRYIKEHKQYLK